MFRYFSIRNFTIPKYWSFLKKFRKVDAIITSVLEKNSKSYKLQTFSPILAKLKNQTTNILSTIM